MCRLVLMTTKQRAAHYLSMGEVAERTGLAESSVRTYRSRGDMPDPDVMVGRTPGWLEATIDDWAKTLPGRGARTDLVGKDL